jgi:hypothetical protein
MKQATEDDISTIFDEAHVAANVVSTVSERRAVTVSKAPIGS